MFPSSRSARETRDPAGDLSLKGFSALALGVAIWAIYGLMRDDWVIVVANVISLACLVGILTVKLREGRKTKS